MNIVYVNSVTSVFYVNTFTCIEAIPVYIFIVMILQYFNNKVFLEIV